mmetsp:Transcript_43881/g.109179  ORF Transcript_43881/g.109179 Transcript_43881/m.109179 type:complete len:285 (+) Transcript_43881:483-1337(+)
MLDLLAVSFLTVPPREVETQTLVRLDGAHPRTQGDAFTVDQLYSRRRIGETLGRHVDRRGREEDVVRAPKQQQRVLRGVLVSKGEVLREDSPLAVMPIMHRHGADVLRPSGRPGEAEEVNATPQPRGLVARVLDRGDAAVATARDAAVLNPLGQRHEEHRRCALLLVVQQLAEQTVHLRLRALPLEELLAQQRPLLRRRALRPSVLHAYTVQHGGVAESIQSAEKVISLVVALAHVREAQRRELRRAGRGGFGLGPRVRHHLLVFAASARHERRRGGRVGGASR